MKDESSENKNLYVKPPSLFKMLKTFTGETANFIKDRLDSCMKCEHLQKKHMKCGLCGCMLQFKARMKTTDCPDRPSRWKEQVLDDKR